ncbi:MAG: hypothetical protein ACXVSA_20455 [Solirubrobacteraceae bacterium]
MSGSRLLIATFVALGLVAVSQSRGDVPVTPCAATVAGQPAFSASDLDELQSSRLIATHTLQLTTDFGDTLADNVKFSMPASVTVIRPHGDFNAGPSGLIFFSDQPGAVPVTITWTQDDGNGGTCAGTASTTLQLQPATRIGRMKNVRAAEHLHPNLKFDLGWRFQASVGRSADLNPVQVMARGVRQPRLPGAKVPFKTVTVPLRDGDPGVTDGNPDRILLPGWTVSTEGGHDAFDLSGDARGTTPRNAPLGYEVKVLQSGRLLAHLRLAGVCNSFNCTMRTVKVQLP